jgi:hypothetical protein
VVTIFRTRRLAGCREATARFAARTSGESVSSTTTVLVSAGGALSLAALAVVDCARESVAMTRNAAAMM